MAATLQAAAFPLTLVVAYVSMSHSISVPLSASLLGCHLEKSNAIANDNQSCKHLLHSTLLQQSDGLQILSRAGHADTAAAGSSAAGQQAEV